MCGRLACGLKPEEICNSCCYKEPGNSDHATPEWKSCHNLGKTYKPSYNLCPTDVAPVLLSGKHFKSNLRVVAPMVFGVIPHWVKPGEKIKYSTINCRLETIKTSKLYSNLLEKGQRCVVICNGYYEWQKQANGKTPYFIHAEQPEGVQVDNPDTWKLESSGNSLSFKPLKLAALFEISSSDSAGEMTLSFTIITKESNSDLNWLHGRMPVILETNEQLNLWLDSEEIDSERALQCIQQKFTIICVPVSNSVNTVGNKDITCIKKQQNSKEKKKNVGSTSFFKNWIEGGQKRKCDDNDDENISEKIKKES